MLRKITKTGSGNGSLYITIPKFFVDELELHEGQIIDFRKSGNKKFIIEIIENKNTETKE